MLEVDGLSRSYGRLEAVSELTFVAPGGEILGLVGPNGAGKTSTLRCLAGILLPTRGRVRICGHDLRAQSIEARRRLAFVADEPRLFDYLTVQEHLTFSARLHGVKDAESKAATLLGELELAGRERSLPGELS